MKRTLVFLVAAAGMILAPDIGAQESVCDLFSHLESSDGQQLVITGDLIISKDVPILGAAGLLAISLWTFTLLGKEFLPELDEGDIWLRVKFPIGISLAGVRPYTRDIRTRLLAFPDVRTIVSQVGAPDDELTGRILRDVEQLQRLRRRTTRRRCRRG